MKGIWQFFVLFLELFYMSELGQNKKLKEKRSFREFCFKKRKEDPDSRAQCTWGDRF